MTHSPGTPALRIEGLSKSWGDFRLGPLNLDLEPGTVMAFVGPNGAGKSTTLNCIVGLVRADTGGARIFGRPNDPNAVDWKHDIGFVGEVSGFYQRWTVRRNLEFLSGFYSRWSDEYVLGLARRLELPLDKKVKTLSKGNRSKLSFVAALGHRPRLLLLDEPTSGLDPMVRTEALDILWELLEDGETSIFYSTHILSDISRLADQMLFLHGGQLRLATRKDELEDQWRRISFRATAGIEQVPGMVRLSRDGREHRLVTRDRESTLQYLQELDATDIQEARMTIEEISVELLKELKKGHYLTTIYHKSEPK